MPLVLGTPYAQILKQKILIIFQSCLSNGNTSVFTNSVNVSSFLDIPTPYFLNRLKSTIFLRLFIQSEHFLYLPVSKHHLGEAVIVYVYWIIMSLIFKTEKSLISPVLSRQENIFLFTILSYDKLFWEKYTIV